ncbi:MAG: hypothetical protein H8E27_06215 [Verrucomicrobia subdivision 3 bacterium]|nr:hypothetical protein [Limisphaerales bacterium]
MLSKQRHIKLLIISIALCQVFSGNLRAENDFFVLEYEEEINDDTGLVEYFESGFSLTQGFYEQAGLINKFGDYIETGQSSEGGQYISWTPQPTSPEFFETSNFTNTINHINWFNDKSLEEQLIEGMNGYNDLDNFFMSILIFNKVDSITINFYPKALIIEDDPLKNDPVLHQQEIEITLKNNNNELEFLLSLDKQKVDADVVGLRFYLTTKINVRDLRFNEREDLSHEVEFGKVRTGFGNAVYEPGTQYRYKQHWADEKFPNNDNINRFVFGGRINELDLLFWTHFELNVFLVNWIESWIE